MGDILRLKQRLVPSSEFWKESPFRDLAAQLKEIAALKDRVDRLDSDPGRVPDDLDYQLGVQLLLT